MPGIAGPSVLSVLSCLAVGAGGAEPRDADGAGAVGRAQLQRASQAQALALDVVADAHAEVGQCPHKLLLHPARPDRLWQQNHFGVYLSDDRGTPGSTLTFFVWPDAGDGRAGNGQTMTVGYTVPLASLAYWSERLVRKGVKFEKPFKRFEETVLRFRDPDGLIVEIVAHPDGDKRKEWEGGGIPAEHSLRGFHSITLSLAALKLVSLPPRLIETTIALSIVVAGLRMRYAISHVTRKPSRATSGRSPTRSERSCWRRACSSRSRAWGSATCT